MKFLGKLFLVCVFSLSINASTDRVYLEVKAFVIEMNTALPAQEDIGNYLLSVSIDEYNGKNILFKSQFDKKEFTKGIQRTRPSFQFTPELEKNLPIIFENLIVKNYCSDATILHLLTQGVVIHRVYRWKKSNQIMANFTITRQKCLLNSLN